MLNAGLIPDDSVYSSLGRSLHTTKGEKNGEFIDHSDESEHQKAITDEKASTFEQKAFTKASIYKCLML